MCCSRRGYTAPESTTFDKDKKTMAKRKMGYLIFDLPSNQEVEGSLSTECDTIQAIISNKGMAAQVKRIKVASPERFMSYPTYKYQVQFVQHE
jgi:hypothetical protein